MVSRRRGPRNYVSVILRSTDERYLLLPEVKCLLLSFGTAFSQWKPEVGLTGFNPITTPITTRPVVTRLLLVIN